MAGLLRRAALALMGFTTAALAAPPPAELFYKDAELVDMVLSPSGRKVALTTSKGVDRLALVVMDLDQGGKLNVVARFRDGDVYGARWVDDERLVYGVVDTFDGSARYSGAPGLFGQFQRAMRHGLGLGCEFRRIHRPCPLTPPASSADAPRRRRG